MLNPLKFMWLEITGRCNLSCSHCYASSSPQGTHGSMALHDWQRIIADAADLGCKDVQFIGGEPTTHPALPSLIRYAHQQGLGVEIYSNLVSVKPQLWDVFQECSACIATSFYTANPMVHEEITRGHNGFERTAKNIKQAIALSIPLRAGMVQIKESQNLNEAKKFLRDLGVQRISGDKARGVGRGTTLVQVGKPEDELCGACARGKAAVMPNGDVFPCVFSRWMRIGNVLEEDFKEIVTGQAMTETRTKLTQFFSLRHGTLPRDDCEPYSCDPNCEPGECSPVIPPTCQPNTLCIPDYKEPCNPEQPCSPDTCNPDACNPDKL